MFEQIGGNINLGSAPGMNFSGNPQAMAKSYQSAYENARNINQQMYQNVMSGYQTMVGGHNKLQSSVMKRLQGTNRANMRDIAARYAQESGAMSQQMIDRGLGNTTVQQSMQRGLLQDNVREKTRSRGQFAQMMAGAESQLGLAGLGAQQNQLNWMGSISAPYPDPGMYAQMAHMMSAGNSPGMLPNPNSGMGGGTGRPIGGMPWRPASGGGYMPGMPDGGGMSYGAYNSSHIGGLGGQAYAGIGKGNQGYYSGTETYGGGQGYMPANASSGYDAWAPTAGTDYSRMDATGYYDGGKFVSSY
jgi:hypothetical protein